MISTEGDYDAWLSRWLLGRASPFDRDGRRIHTTWHSSKGSGPASRAESVAIDCIETTQTALMSSNAERIDQERGKLERFYGYRTATAADKLESVRRTFERLSTSEVPEVQRIIPVWAKNLENAKRVVQNTAEERQRRLADLDGLGHVDAQHHVLSASYVEIVPSAGDTTEAAAED